MRKIGSPNYDFKENNRDCCNVIKKVIFILFCELFIQIKYDLILNKAKQFKFVQLKTS